MAEIIHRIETKYMPDGRSSWECSCGYSGSTLGVGDVDLASDRHIDVANGDIRIDV